MKFTGILLLAFSLQVTATGISQTVTLSKENASLTVIFDEISRQTGYEIIYNSQMIENAKKVSINVKNASLVSVLDLCFAYQTLKYEIDNKAIIVKPKPPTPDLSQGLGGSFSSRLLPPPPITVRGRVVNEKGEPVTVSVFIKGTNRGTTSDTNGNFELNDVNANSILIISASNIETKEVSVEDNKTLEIVVKTFVRSMDEITILSTGYQNLPKERATGSFASVTNKLFNRQVSTDVLSRLNGIAPGLLFDQRNQGSSPKLSIRGLSTILANDQPLIIVDNFPFSGDLNVINPNDVESVTILRDAAAASIWGARAGNGVIVITTKKGLKNDQLQVDFNINFTHAGKPDLYYNQEMTTSDVIDVQKKVFDLGFFDEKIDRFSQPVLGPVVDIFRKEREGLLTNGEASLQLNELRDHDFRDEQLKYFYRKTQVQQYSVSLRGGSNRHNYFLSLGYDHIPENLVKINDDRLTLNFQNSMKITNKLSIDTRLVYSATNSQNSNTLSYFAAETYKYTKITDNEGNPADIPYQYRNEFIQNASSLGYLRWNYNPLEELNNSYTSQSKNVNLRSNTILSYQMLDGLSIEALYQYETQIGKQKTLYSKDSYFVRDMINTYSSFDGNAVSKRYIPPGQILTRYDNEIISHNARIQANFNREWKMHSVFALAGFEVRQATQAGLSSRLYGYNDELGSFGLIDQTTQFASYPSYQYVSVPSGQDVSGTIDKFKSYFANAAYSYKSRYTISASGRIDQSNLFGVNTNQKSAPLWSIGAKWDVLKESFLNIDGISLLNIRISHGFSGNIDQNVTAFTTANFLYSTLTQREGARIVSPPNPDLRWEKSRMTNLAIDFGLFDNRLTGKVERYWKRGLDLMGQASIDPTQGLTIFRGNIASMKGSGWDIELNSINIKRALTWESVLSVSYATDKITKYLFKDPGIVSYFADNSLSRNSNRYSPVEGRPVFGVYSLSYAGLERETGDPLGYLNGKPSNDYTSIFSNYTFDSLTYHGRALPPVFGALRNTLTYKGCSLSFNIIYKFGYYFRNQSISYDDFIISETSKGHADYTRRWQKAGDELTTNIPSERFNVPSRDNFYRASAVLIDKGDNIRLQDIQLSYNFSSRLISKIKLNKIQFYFYLNNVGIIWKSTPRPIDPDFPLSKPIKTAAIGLRTSF